MLRVHRFKTYLHLNLTTILLLLDDKYNFHQRVFVEIIPSQNKGLVGTGINQDDKQICI